MKKVNVFLNTAGSKSLGKVIIILAVVLAVTVTIVLVGCQKDTPDLQDMQGSASATENVDSELPTAPTDAKEVKIHETQPAEISPTETKSSKTQSAATKPSTGKTSESESSETSPSWNLPWEKTYTVTFKDYDGTVLKVQQVKHGKSAAAPADPSREYYTFAGWDKSFQRVKSDLIVTATYTTTRTIIYAESVTVNKGNNEVSMNIRVRNNPGIMGAVLKVSVDDKVFAFAEGKNTQYPGLTLTPPGSKTTASPYTFMLDALELSGKDQKDGTLFTITFKIKNPRATGNFQVGLSYDEGDIFDEDYQDPRVVLENGIITIQ